MQFVEIILTFVPKYISLLGLTDLPFLEQKSSSYTSDTYWLTSLKRKISCRITNKAKKIIVQSENSSEGKKQLRERNHYGAISLSEGFLSTESFLWL